MASDNLLLKISSILTNLDHLLCLQDLIESIEGIPLELLSYQSKPIDELRLLWREKFGSYIHSTYLYVYSGLTKEKSSKRNEFGSSSDRVWVGFVSGLSQVWVEFRSGLGQVHTYFLDVNPLWTHVYLYTFFPSLPSTQVSRFPFRLPTYYLISWFTIHIRKLINNCLIRPASNLLIMKSN